MSLAESMKSETYLYKYFFTSTVKMLLKIMHSNTLNKYIK